MLEYPTDADNQSLAGKNKQKYFLSIPLKTSVISSNWLQSELNTALKISFFITL